MKDGEKCMLVEETNISQKGIKIYFTVFFMSQREFNREDRIVNNVFKQLKVKGMFRT
jgi:hypothetical protein